MSVFRADRASAGARGRAAVFGDGGRDDPPHGERGYHGKSCISSLMPCTVHGITDEGDLRVCLVYFCRQDAALSRQRPPALAESPDRLASERAFPRKIHTLYVCRSLQGGVRVSICTAPCRMHTVYMCMAYLTGKRPVAGQSSESAARTSPTSTSQASRSSRSPPPPVR